MDKPEKKKGYCRCFKYRLKFGSLSKAYSTEERLSGHVARNVRVVLQLEMFELKINNSYRLFF
jgi:hypothetical protein